MTTDVFGEEYAGIYDVLYEEKQYDAEAAYVRALLRDAGVAEGSVVEFGSGTGIHGQLLAWHGYVVHGVERSAAMAAASERRAVRSGTPWRVTVGDARDARVPGVFDAALALFHVLSYQTSDSDVGRLLGNAAAHLRPGGVFVFDVWHADAVLSIRPALRVKRAQAGDRHIVRIAEPTLHEDRHVVDVNYTVFTEIADDLWRRTTEEHVMRYFTADELREACARHGLEIIRSEEWMTGSAPAASTWGVCYVARKTA